MSYELHHSINREVPESEKKSSLLKTTLDKIAYPIALIVPLSSLDQVFSIWSQKSAAGVSIIVWFMLLMTSIFWMFYGFVHREKAIFFGHVVWFILSSIILIEIMLFT